MRFSRSAWVADSRSSSAPMPWTLAATAGAGGAAGVSAAVLPLVVPAAGSSCLEHAPTAAASSMHATSRDFGESVKVINIPPWWNLFGLRTTASPYHAVWPDCQPHATWAQAAPRHARRASLADAEAGEDVAEHLVGGDLAGQFTQCLVGHAQLLGGQFQMAGLQLGGRVGARLQGAAQGLEVAGAGTELAFGGLWCAPGRQATQGLVQLFQPLAGKCGHVDLALHRRRQRRQQVGLVVDPQL